MSAVTLAEVRPCLEGVIPAMMATTAADGTPNGIPASPPAAS